MSVQAVGTDGYLVGSFGIDITSNSGDMGHWYVSVRSKYNEPGEWFEYEVDYYPKEGVDPGSRAFLQGAKRALLESAEKVTRGLVLKDSVVTSGDLVLDRHLCSMQRRQHFRVEAKLRPQIIADLTLKGAMP